MLVELTPHLSENTYGCPSYASNFVKLQRFDEIEQIPCDPIAHQAHCLLLKQLEQLEIVGEHGGGGGGDVGFPLKLQSI